METKKKKLQLKKETIAVLNDPEMNNIRVAGAPGAPGGQGMPGAPGTSADDGCTRGCSDGPICSALTIQTGWNCTYGQCTL